MRVRAWVLALLCAAAAPLSGEEFSFKNVSINGYGTWYDGQTSNANLYLGLPEDGDSLAEAFLLGEPLPEEKESEVTRSTGGSWRWPARRSAIWSATR